MAPIKGANFAVFLLTCLTIGSSGVASFSSVTTPQTTTFPMTSETTTLSVIAASTMTTTTLLMTAGTTTLTMTAGTTTLPMTAGTTTLAMTAALTSSAANPVSASTVASANTLVQCYSHQCTYNILEDACLDTHLAMSNVSVSTCFSSTCQVTMVERHFVRSVTYQCASSPCDWSRTAETSIRAGVTSACCSTSLCNADAYLLSVATVTSRLTYVIMLVALSAFVFCR